MGATLRSVVAAAGLAVGVTIAAPPLEFKGLRPGLSRSEHELGVFFHCRQDFCALQKTAPQQTIAGAPVRGVYLELDGDLIGSVHVVFDSVDFGRVKEAFLAKYPALRCETSSVQNRMGASFDQEICRVRDSSSRLLLHKRAGKIDESDLMIISHAFSEATRQKEASKKGDI